MEACGASNDVELMLRTICGLYTFGGDLDNGVVDWLDIWLRERLEITLAGCQTSAAWRPVRDHEFLESLVVAELLPHIVLHATQRLALSISKHYTWHTILGTYSFFRILIDWVVSEEHPKHTNHTLFDVVPILEKVVLVVSKPLLFLFCVLVYSSCFGVHSLRVGLFIADAAADLKSDVGWIFS